MPTYTFRCLKCQKEIEITCSIKESEVLDPLCFEGSCEGSSTTRVIQATAFSLKGGGWAADGYSKK